MIDTFDVKPSGLTLARSNFSPHTGYPNGGSSSFRIGWRNVTTPGYSYYYNAFFILDFSEFADRRVTQDNLISAKFRLSGVSGNHGLTSALYRVLRNVTASLDWQTYNGTNNWAVAGGTGSGTDRSSSPLMTMSEKGVQELTLSAATLFSIYNDSWKFGIYTTSSIPQYDNYHNLTYDDTVIRISYNRYNLAGDATMFQM